MANPEHLTLLRKAEDWSRWRKEHPRVIPDLRGADLSNANLRGANLIGADLPEAHLRGADLHEAHLSNANLRGSNLSGADLSRADLSRADLIEANLRKADLREADLSRADLSAAVLSRADLSGTYLLATNFSRANLYEANLSGARVGWTVLGNVDLSVAKGLDTVKHEGPSTIGIDTLCNSGGKIPDVFLRGAGVPDNFIAYVGSLVGQPMEFYSCFVSYSHADKGFARRLHDTLQGRGIRCWLDEHQLLPGDDIYDQVDRGIRLWDKVLLCCSKHSLSSWWVDSEIDRAFEKERTLMKERGRKTLALIPLDLDGHLLGGQWQSGKAQEVLSRFVADFKGWSGTHERFESAVERIILALRADQGARLQAPKPRL